MFKSMRVSRIQTPLKQLSRTIKIITINTQVDLVRINKT